MAVLRSFNFLGQMRVDVPHLRMVESAVTEDFSLLAGKMLAGRAPLILRGFTVSTTNTVGTPAENLQVNVAAGLIMHFAASDAGTIFSVADDAATETLISTNPKVFGAFTAGVTNYIGLDLVKSADESTSDLVQFLDANTNLETPQIVPLGRTLQFRLVISTQNFTVSTNILPIAQVITDANNNVVSITDARKLMFRLGAGGDNPAAQGSYAWGNRTENDITYTGGGDSFTGEDKSINNLKSWMDAIMTSIWEVKGGQFWYSPTNRDGVKLLYGSPVLATNGDNFDWDLGTQTLSWRGLQVAFENSPADTNIISHATNPDSAVLPDGSALYVDIQRELPDDAVIFPAVADLNTLGTSAIPGRRVILAWRIGSLVYTRDRAYEVNRAFQVATTSILGIVRLNNTAGTPSSPVVVSIMADGQAEVEATANNSYAFKGTAPDNSTDSASNTLNPFVPGPSTGGVFLGGEGTFGGDGLQAAAGGTGKFRTGVNGSGNFPTAAGIQGGTGVCGFGGYNTTVIAVGTGAMGGTGTCGFGGQGQNATSGAATGGLGGVGGDFFGGIGGPPAAGAIEGIGGIAGNFLGGNGRIGGSGIVTIGGIGSTSVGGTGIVATGGSPSGAGGIINGTAGAANGGTALFLNAGAGTAGTGGEGLLSNGGAGTTIAGRAGAFTGGNSSGAGGGHRGGWGASATGGNATNGGGAAAGGNGFVATGGTAAGTGVGGNGIESTGGASASGAGGHGLLTTGAAGAGANAAGYGLIATGGNSASGTDGIGVWGIGGGTALGGYFTTINNGVTVVKADGYVHVDSDQPFKTTPHTDKLTSKNIIKVWCKIQISAGSLVDGADGTGFIEGFNMTNVTSGASAININFGDDFISADTYAMSAIVSAPRVACVSSNVAGSVSIAIYDVTTASLVNPTDAGTNLTLWFQAVGGQP